MKAGKLKPVRRPYGWCPLATGNLAVGRVKWSQHSCERSLYQVMHVRRELLPSDWLNPPPLNQRLGDSLNNATVEQWLNQTSRDAGVVVLGTCCFLRSLLQGIKKMPTLKTFFKQSCPVCGRPLYIPVDLLGKEASCTHCSGVFAAEGQDAACDTLAARGRASKSRKQIIANA